MVDELYTNALLVVEKGVEYRDPLRRQVASLGLRPIFVDSASSAFPLSTEDTILGLVCDWEGSATERLVRGMRFLCDQPCGSLILSSHGADHCGPALRSGAFAYVRRPVDRIVFRSLVRRLCYFTRALQRQPKSPSSGHLPPLCGDAETLMGLDSDVRPLVARFRAEFGLTERQTLVLGLLILGRRNVEISQILSISINTTKYLAKEVLARTGASSRSELFRISLTL